MRRFPRNARPSLALISSATALIALSTPDAHAESWTLSGNGSWNQATNWNPASIPNAVGATAVFNSAASGQTASRTITLDGPQTVGSLVFNNDLPTPSGGSAINNTISAGTGTGAGLIFDEAGAGPATITTTGSVNAGTGNTTISAPMTLNDSLVAIVNNTTASSGAGSLNLTGTISGTGGFTKEGDGIATFGTAAKTYTGPTVLNAGRMRISTIGQPANSSSFTINAGAQLTPIGSVTLTLGASTLNLNGDGPTSGPFSAFPGAIRQDTNAVVTITNPVVLQSDTLVHVQGSTSGSLTFTSPVSGPGSLALTALIHDANLGTLILKGANTYSGGTIVNGGTVRLSGSAASLGTGDVTIYSASVPNSANATASAKITIETGVLDAISNTATLSLAGGNAFGTADDGFIELQSGVNEIVGRLILGGVEQAFGTYGSSESGAASKLNEYFSGPGIVTVIPEPGAAALLLAGLGVLGAARRRR